jgi:hypothetical protein
MMGPITLDAKHAGERSAGKPPAPFDEAGAGNVAMAAGLRASAKHWDNHRSLMLARQSSTLPSGKACHELVAARVCGP